MRLRRDFIKIPLASAFAPALSLPELPAFAQQVTLLNVSRLRDNLGFGLG